MSRVSEPLDISQKKESKEAINPLPPQSTSINGSFIDFNVCHLCSFDLKVTFNLEVYLVNKTGKKARVQSHTKSKHLNAKKRADLHTLDFFGGESRNFYYVF